MIANDRAAGVVVRPPSAAPVPVVVASPHSGRDYPADLQAASRLDAHALRRSEDAFVDRLIADAPALGASVIEARFPRVYVDVNREPYELDPTMFTGPLPDFANTSSPRVAAGLGTIARIVTSGEDIYARRLTVAEGLERITRHHRPYHAALRELVEAVRARFGVCVLLDCHSMPSVGLTPNPGGGTVDMVLGNAFGASCGLWVLEAAEQTLRAQGHVVRRNVPYSGGYTTRAYGRPLDGVHALQLEINRTLYMDEGRIVPHAGLDTIRAAVAAVIAALGRAAPVALAAE